MVEGLLAPEMQLATDSSMEHTPPPDTPYQMRDLFADLQRTIVSGLTNFANDS